MKDLNEQCNNCKCLPHQCPADYWTVEGTAMGIDSEGEGYAVHTPHCFEMSGEYR